MRSFTVFFQRDVMEEQTIHVKAENVVDAAKKAREELKKNPGSWEGVEVGPPQLISCVEEA